eukprot:131534-Karenia_brevis.AAC.1
MLTGRTKGNGAAYSPLLSRLIFWVADTANLTTKAPTKPYTTTSNTLRHGFDRNWPAGKTQSSSRKL